MNSFLNIVLWQIFIVALDDFITIEKYALWHVEPANLKKLTLKFRLGIIFSVAYVIQKHIPEEIKVPMVFGKQHAHLFS